MKQYRTLLLIITVLFVGWTFLTVETCAQVKLTQVESDTVRWRIPVSHRTIPGQSGKYFMKYMGLAALMDSLGIKGTKIDSMTFASDTLKLYTSDGIFKVEIISGGGGSGTVTSISTTSPITGGPITTSGTIGINTANASTTGALTSTDWNTFNNKIGGSGTTNYIPKFSGSTSLGNSNIFDDGTNLGLAWGFGQKIGLGTLSPDADCHVVGDYFRLNNGFKFRTDGANSAEFSSPNDLYFYTDVAIGTAPSGVGLLSLANNQVGIKDFTPSYDLDVNGTARVVSRTGTATQLLGTDLNGKLVNTSASGMAINGSTAFTWDNPSTANMYFGDAGTGSGTIFWTPSLSSSFASGLAIDGSYASSIATVNLKAFGVKSGGPYRSELAFHTTSGTTMTERMRILQDGTIKIGNLAGTGNRLVLTSSTGDLGPVALGTGLSFTGTTLNASLTEVDGSITNEGYQGVTAGSGTSSVIQGYNSAGTATGTGTTINAAGSISISETTSANGGQITLSGDYGAFTVAATTGGSSVVATDGSALITYAAGSGMTVTRSGTTSPTITFASTGGATNLSYSTKSGTDVTLVSDTGNDVIFRDGVGTFVNRVSANVIKYDVDEIYGQLSNTAIIGSTTIDGVYRSVDFTVADESFASIIDAKTASDEIEVLVAGTYEIHYSLSYLVPSNRDVRWRIYKNTADIGYIGELTTYFTAGYPSKTFITTLAANDKISLRFLGVNGVSGTIDINSPVLKVRRIK